MHRLSLLALLTLSVLAPACTSVTAPPRTVAASAPTWTPQTPFPAPEGDLAYVRSYAQYTPDQERHALLVMFLYRAQRENLPGFVQVWGDAGRPHVNMKRPYDRQAMLALASPELRPLLIVHDVAHNSADIAIMQKQLISLLETGKPGDWEVSHNYRNDRFDVIIVGEDNAARLRRMLPPELAGITDITVSEGPIHVLVGAQGQSPK